MCSCLQGRSWLLFLLLSYLSFVTKSCSTCEHGVGQNVTSIIQSLLRQSTNKLCRPFAQGNDPVIIKTDVKLVSIGHFREADMQFTVEMYFRQSWLDPRLAFTHNSTDSITLNGDMTDNLWQPDTYFENEVEGKIHGLTVKNKFMRIHKNGYVLTSTRMTLSCSCSMDFRKFPMDEQKCGIYFASYGYTTKDIIYEWEERHETLSQEHEIPQFVLKDIEMFNITRQYLTGAFSSLGIKLNLTRRLGHYLTRVYIPAILIVMLSWLSFYVDRHSAPARVSLGITTVLTMTTLLIGVGQGALPVVAYIKALDWYLFVSYFMVFAAFAEYAVINYRDKACSDELRRRQKREALAKAEQNGAFLKESDQENSAAAKAADMIYVNGIPLEAYDFLKCPASREQIKPDLNFSDWFVNKFLSPPELIDTWSKKLFPLFFIVFNVTYWMYYLVISD